MLEFVSHEELELIQKKIKKLEEQYAVLAKQSTSSEDVNSYIELFHQKIQLQDEIEQWNLVANYLAMPLLSHCSMSDPLYEADTYLQIKKIYHFYRNVVDTILSCEILTGGLLPKHLEIFDFIKKKFQNISYAFSIPLGEEELTNELYETCSQFDSLPAILKVALEQDWPYEDFYRVSRTYSYINLETRKAKDMVWIQQEQLYLSLKYFVVHHILKDETAIRYYDKQTLTDAKQILLDLLVDQESVEEQNRKLNIVLEINKVLG